MNYTLQITINVPREVFIEKMDNLDNLKHWQKGLKKIVPISGASGQEGSKTKLSYEINKREMEMVETVITRKMPEEFHATYDTQGVHNIQKNYFIDNQDNTTTWRSETEFKFSSFGLRVLAFFMPKVFKKQSLKYMNDFKAFAEEGKSVLEKEV
ncbi:SRPBCC family protein [Haloflavibacter putidus]|uniref:SRPBCC family protein n=1 Tax=Haloflavibacter putidus TaxID=2576776 RepID=A0A507ZNR2_9FLAO|nr:SRPBCC family protein [Haloflavibacter putidus]TQD38627.1 SRPBCC family protein [Haloflavibacter putidus]